ncbi:MAG: DUF4197 domain-containing protein [Pseudomonadota bacterium]|jgi:hypothetical protein|nr:DUF4197 domain-containing protein [Rubrivivax sp.]MCA3259304.1 DUF4197 domain-containing protein [Rubrivivax sp.]MCE2913724.1 DUF4197 domain-containing protein [Rubrivivax sp.]MCZ8031303.1 DUF4197 domain-containing protein [Rubrivivax sp.]
MDRRECSGALFHLGLAGGWLVAAPAWAAALSEGDAASGVRAALERGALAAVGLLGRQDGFLGNPKVRIPLPGALEDAAKLLRAAGQGKRVDELVTAMNRAAEAAVPEAKSLFVDTVRQMSVEDALGIVRGGDTSVTDFFARKTRTPLGAKFLPIVTRATEKVQLAERYNAVAAKATGLGLLRGGQASIQQYVTGKALDGLYLMVGEEEKKIRADPVKTGSAILKKVFGR